MAEDNDDTEKSEDPTQKRLDDALKRGDVAKSQEVSTWFIIAGATLVLISFSAQMGSSLQATLAGLLANSWRIPADGGGLIALTSRIGFEVMAAMGLPLIVLLWPDRDRLESFITVDPAALLPIVLSLSLKLLGAVVAILAFIAAADFLFQYQQWYARQKMSFRDLREEFRQSEGDPHIKARIRRLREQRSRKRMMAAVPEASVVITNPTH